MKEEFAKFCKEVNLKYKRTNTLYKGLASWSDTDFSIDKEGFSALQDETIDFYRQISIIKTRRKDDLYFIKPEELFDLINDVKFLEKMYYMLKKNSSNKNLKNDIKTLIEQLNTTLFYNKSGYRTKEEEIKYTTEI